MWFKWIVLIVLLAIGPGARASGQQAGCGECTSKILEAESALPVLQEVRGQTFSIRVKRQVRAAAGDEAYRRVEAAIGRALEARGGRVEPTSKGTVEVEVDTWFYVLTSKFNARRIWLSEFAQVELDGPSEGASVEAPTPSVDALRVITGVVAVSKGWISPGFGAYMVGSGARDSFFGSGTAPNRTLLADAARYARGEHEVASRVKVSVGGKTASFVVVTSTRGDEEPYQVQGLAESNWSTLGDLIVRPNR